MKYTLRALGWATIILWIILIFLVVTLVYSALQTRIGAVEPQLLVEGDKITLAMSVTLSNNGFYGIYDLNLTTVVETADGAALFKNSSFVPLIPKRVTQQIWHNISVSLMEILSYQTFLTQDANLTVKQLASLKFAKILPCSFLFNSTMPWGAPLYNLSVRMNEPFFNGTHYVITLSVSFENHSPYIDVNGTLQLEVLNENGENVGTVRKFVNVPHQSNYDETFEIPINASDFSSSGTIKLTFETPMFSYEREVPYEYS